MMNPEPVKRPKSAGQNGKRGSPADVTEAALGKGPCGAPFAKGQPENDHFGEATPGGEMPATTERSASKGSASRTESASRTDSIAQPQTTVSKAANEKESAGALVLHTEPTAYVFIQTVDGDIEKVEKDVALLSPFVHREVNRHGRGYSRDSPVALPKQVSPAVLKLVLEYCRFHRVSGRSDKERKIFDEKFIRLDTRVLCELTSAADSLDMKPLVDLTSRALARMIEGKTPEEIRETFHLPDDLTEEEKLEPVKNATDDPRIRLLNRLYARKRKELQDKKMTKQEVQASGGGKKDDRSVEALLQFIDGAAGSKKSKSKKKKKKGKRDEAEDHTSEDGSVQGAHGAPCEEKDDVSVEAEELGSSHVGSQRQGGSRGQSRLGSWLGKGAGQDGLLPEQEGDEDEGGGRKEVPESTSALSGSDWTERMQEILALASSSQDRLQSLPGGKTPPPATPPAWRRDEDPIQAKLRTIQELHEQLRLGQNLENLELPRFHRGGMVSEGAETPPDGEGDGLADVVVAAAAAAAEAAAAAAMAAREAAARCRSGGEKSGGDRGGEEEKRLDRQASHENGTGGMEMEAGRSRSVDRGHQSRTGSADGRGEEQSRQERVSRRQGSKGKGAANGGGPVEAGLQPHSRGENGAGGHRSNQPWSGIALLEAQQTAAFLQKFLKRVGFDPIVDVGMRGGLPGIELSEDHMAEQWAPDGHQMSMCVRLASGSIVSIAVAKPPPPGGQEQRGGKA